MRRFFVPVLFLAVSISTATANAAEGDAQLDRGSVGVLFQFGGLSTLATGAFDGGLGAKYFLTRNLALRGSLAINTASESTPANPGQNQAGIDGSASGSQYGLGVAAEYHLLTGKVSPYVGGGLSFSTASTNWKEDVVYTTGGTVPTQTEVQNNGGCEDVAGRTFCAGSAFGIGAIAGVEFFPFEHVSLSAEYQIGYNHLSRADQKVIMANQTTTTKYGSAGQVAISTLGLLTLGIYF